MNRVYLESLRKTQRGTADEKDDDGRCIKNGARVQGRRESLSGNKKVKHVSCT